MRMDRSLVDYRWSESTGKPKEEESIAPPLRFADTILIADNGGKMPIGGHNKMPETEHEHPAYARVVIRDGGLSATVGPFDLTTEQIKDWKRHTDNAKLDEMVSQGRLRESTGAMVKEAKHQNVVLEMLQLGQVLSPDLVKKYIPADLQRAVKDYVDSK